MVTSNYTPEKGDLVWLDFTPQAGHEQKGRRPAICISQKKYNKKTGLALFCPITSHIKGYPFEIVLDKSDSVKNSALMISPFVKLQMYSSKLPNSF